MARTRDELHELLCEVLGSRNVYFQPPEGMKMKYPAIVYRRNDKRAVHADNLPYMVGDVYDLTVIDEDPDSEIVTRVARLPRCRYDRFYTADELNHDVFTIYN